MKPKVCRFCKTTFIPNSSKAVYCSKECKQMHIREKRYRKKWDAGLVKQGVHPDKLLEFLSTEQTCPVCGTRYYPHHGEQRCCNYRCGNTLIKRELSAKIRPVLTLRKCEACGKEYMPNRCTQRFCSKKCNDKFSMKRLHAYKRHAHIPLAKQRRACKVCGIEFTPVRANQKCCSIECSAKNLRMLELSRQKGTGGNKGSGRARGSTQGAGAIQTKCEYCGKEFTAFNVRTKFCSDECRYKRDQHKREEQFKRKYLAKECLECGKSFQPRYKDQVCCSEACQKLRRYKWAKGKAHYPTNGTKNSKGEALQSRNKLIAHVTGKNNAVVTYDKLLHLQPDDFRKALADMTAEERKKFITWGKTKYQIKMGAQQSMITQNKTYSPRGFRDKIIDAINGGYLGCFTGGNTKMREERIKKEQEKDSE